ncbi:MAG: prohibitin family protein [Candidatus Melainabacteria bacterium]|jgi:prohibitin 2|nr:prohibitin family protein [Candidatus Melainabacteria bacterium]
MDKPDIPDFFNARNFKNGGSFDPDDFLGKNKWTILIIIFAIFIVPNFVILVGAGQRAIIFNRVTGMEKRVLEEGVQIIIPLMQQATTYDVREISYIFSDKSARSKRGARIMGNSIQTLTADGQNITADVTIRARPDFKELWWLHQNLGNDSFTSYVDKIITPVVRSIVREVVSGYTVSAIYSEDRRTIANKVSVALAEKLKSYRIVVTEFLLDEVTFSDAYQSAIEGKQRARIDLDTKDNIIVEERNKRDAVITQAQGEAEAIRLKVNALTRNPEYIKFRKAQIFGSRTTLIFDEQL